MLGEETSNRLGTQRDRLNLSNLIKVVSIPNNQTSQPLQNNPQSTAQARVRDSTSPTIQNLARCGVELKCPKPLIMMIISLIEIAVKIPKRDLSMYFTIDILKIKPKTHMLIPLTLLLMI